MVILSFHPPLIPLRSRNNLRSLVWLQISIYGRPVANVSQPALAYHPDRNPGRESEVISQFQKIQSAHEVLIDAQERAKYDANRVRAPSGFRGSYTGGVPSGMKGNPWSNVSSQFPTPPKAPTARTRPSAGAQRYTNFETPRQSAYQAAQNGPDSRQNTYNAFDRMRHQPKQEPGPGKTWAAPPPPPRGTPKSGREESDARAQAEAARSRANARPPSGFDEYREPNTSNRRSQSTNASNRRGGFQPNTPGGDEPPAPKGAYSTQRDKTTAPPPPPRQPPPTFADNFASDPLAQFRKNDLPSMEPRSSQPYTGHGGEKFSLFGPPNVSRSKSTREGSGRFDGGQVPRTGSDSTLNSPHRTKSSAQRPTAASKQTYKSARVDSSSSDDLPEINRSRAGASVNKSNGSAPRTAQQAPDAANRAETTRKQSKISQMRQWMDENPGQEPPPDGFPSDGPPLRSGQASPTTNAANSANMHKGTNGQPSMYADFAHPPTPKSETLCGSSYFLSNDRTTTAQDVSQRDRIQQEGISKSNSGVSRFTPIKVKVPARSPSGLATDSQDLNAFEKEQKKLINQLLSNKRTSSWSQKPPDNSVNSSSYQSADQSRKHFSGDASSQRNSWASFEETTGLGSSFKKPKESRSSSFINFDSARAYWEHLEDLKKPANYLPRPSFTFPVNHDPFVTPQPRANGFSSSADNISTKFTPEDWDGKFEAGADYFKPAPQPAGGVPLNHPRAQSANRSRGRSPPKVRPTVDSRFVPTAEPEIPIESPGGTKFSADEWKETFKPATFMPPNPSVPPRPQSGRKRTLPNGRSTMGGRAAVGDESDTSDEKSTFMNQRTSSPQPSVPEPMDVDTPPATRTVPQFVPAQGNEKLNVNIDPLKRPAASSPSQSPTDEADLKVTFADLNLGTFMSSINLPSPIAPPRLPELSESERPSRESFENYIERYAAYMNSWDEVNTKFLLHMVSRKNQNLEFKEKRWTDDKYLEAYRLGLKEDRAVLIKWTELTEKHEKVVKECAIMKERMKLAEQEKLARPRKKTH
jgi:curved DNA-binding protein CbpA